MRVTLSVVIVAWKSAEYLARTLPALASELADGDEVIIVDNDSPDDLESVVDVHLPAATVIDMGRNAGYTAAITAGAAVATGDLLVVLNPDAMPEPGFGKAIRSPAEEGSPWAAWMALVVCHEDGRRVINTKGNPVHFTGFSWAGGHGSEVPAEVRDETLPAAASGACLAIRPDAWNRVGGFAGEFFLYHEDTDVSLRLRSQGELIGIAGGAVVDHEYDFGRSGHKWLWLERNRWAMIIRNYPAALIVLLAPALVATELALIPVATRGGWLPQKLAAWGQVVRWLPRLLGERRRIQSVRSLSARHFADILTAELDSRYFPDFVRSRPVRLVLRTYWQLVKGLLP